MKLTSGTRCPSRSTSGASTSDLTLTLPQQVYDHHAAQGTWCSPWLISGASASTSNTTLTLSTSGSKPTSGTRCPLRSTSGASAPTSNITSTLPQQVYDHHAANGGASPTSGTFYPLRQTSAANTTTSCCSRGSSLNYRAALRNKVSFEVQQWSLGLHKPMDYDNMPSSNLGRGLTDPAQSLAQMGEHATPYTKSYAKLTIDSILNPKKVTRIRLYAQLLPQCTGKIETTFELHGEDQNNPLSFLVVPVGAALVPELSSSASCLRSSGVSHKLKSSKRRGRSICDRWYRLLLSRYPLYSYLILLSVGGVSRYPSLSALSVYLKPISQYRVVNKLVLGLKYTRKDVYSRIS